MDPARHPDADGAAPKAVPYTWKWSTLYPLAQRAGDLVPVGRGGERRAIALANPGLGGAPDMEVIHAYEGTETIQTLIVGKDLTGVSTFA